MSSAVGKRRGRRIRRLEDLLRERNKLMNQAFGARDKAFEELGRVQNAFDACRKTCPESNRAREALGALEAIARRGFIRRAWWALWSMRRWTRGVRL